MFNMIPYLQILTKRVTLFIQVVDSVEVYILLKVQIPGPILNFNIECSKGCCKYKRDLKLCYQ